VSFNSAFNRSLAVLAYHESDIRLTRQGDAIQVTLTAPLNFDYTEPEPVAITLVSSNGDQEEVELVEPEPFAQILQGTVPLAGENSISQGNGILETSPGQTVHAGYGHGYYERRDELTFDSQGTTVTH
jgi:hypothetical protein